jgi:bifunctional DNA-binding transcriptional regulator/antitoxin component of YhaV-PrlF toxin-antitoxin module
MNELNNINNNQNNNNNNNNITLELHVPCREPLQHLMSMASHFHKKYICDENETKITIEKAIHKVYMNHLGDMRFSNKLLNTNANANENANANANNNIELKCFNPFPLENYINYMSGKLQHRRFTIPKYVRRDTNAKHSKSSECIWDSSTSEEYKQKVIQLLVNKHPYMKFCYDCIGSNNELQLLTELTENNTNIVINNEDDEDDDEDDDDDDDDGGTVR